MAVDVGCPPTLKNITALRSSLFTVTRVAIALGVEECSVFDGLFAPTSNRVGVGREVAHLRVACANVELVELSAQSVERLDGRTDFGDCKGGTILRSIYGSDVWHLVLR